MIKKIKNKNYKAFSFIEVMISVFLLSVGMIAVITLMSGSLRDSLDSRNQVIAAGLAQEGTELVKNIRDTNWKITGNTSFTNIPPVPVPASCIISYGSSSSLSCGGGVYLLNYDVDNFYTHNAGTPTRFQRKIIISDVGTDKNIISMVIWGGSFPADFSTCNTSTKCAFAPLTLTTYGEY